MAESDEFSLDDEALSAGGVMLQEKGEDAQTAPSLPTEWGETPPEWANGESRYDDRQIVGIGRGPSLRVAAAVALAGAARAREARSAEEAQAGSDGSEIASTEGDEAVGDSRKESKPSTISDPGQRQTERKATIHEAVGREPGAVAGVTQATWELGPVEIHARVMRSRQKDPPLSEVVESTGLKLDGGERSFLLFVTRTERHRDEGVRETVTIESTTSGYSFDDFLAALKNAGVNLRVHQTATEYFVEATFEEG